MITAGGKSVVALVIDDGPGCKVENAAGKEVVDASTPVSRYLFGEASGWVDKRSVKVETVARSTALGPVGGTSSGGKQGGKQSSLRSTTRRSTR